ncbi:MAG: M67 family metallopeptidase [Bacteroidota bacterium]
MSILKIDQIAEKEIVRHSEETYPEECCGFLFGKDNGEERKIIEAIPAENIKNENRKKRFEISPEEYMGAEKYALKNDLDLLGIYHSHPDHPAIPSKHDYRQASPFFSYVISSIRKGKYVKMTSWQLDEDRRFQSETIETIDQKQLREQ